MKIILLTLVVGLQFVSAKIYKGAELRTRETYTYGRIDARFMPAEGNGIVASLFTYHEITSLAEWNEIDIEILGRYTDDVQLTTIVPGQLTYSSHHFTRFDPHSAYHTYAFEWTSDYVAWFIDGAEVYRQTGAHVQTLNSPQKIMMNLWASDGATWVGDWNADVLPRFSYYDWVSYSAYTPGAGDRGTNNDFSLQWRDDFDQFDGNRWQKATHTFNGNLVDFLPENIVYKNSKMILCLTDETHTGLTDKSAPVLLWARLQGDSVRARFSEEIARGPAENTGNYGVGNFQILTARLLPDSQTVLLKVRPQDFSGASTMVAFNMADYAQPPNTQSYTLTDLINAVPLGLPFKINAGSLSADAGSLADQVWSPAAEYGHMDGYNQIVNNYNVNNPNMDVVYREELNNLAKYKIRLAPGRYTVALNFSESQYQQAGKRLFDVVLEDSIVARALDLQLVAGLHQPYTLTVADFPVTDGIMDIHFSNWVDRPLINAITVYQTPTALEGNNGLIRPKSMDLFQNYPNPFNPATRIAYSLKQAGTVSLAIYDLKGRRVEELVYARQKAGRHALTFKADGLASGIYIYRMRLESKGRVFLQSHKMILLR